MHKTPKGEMIPQTVENLQIIMAKDAEIMRNLSERIILLHRRIYTLQERVQGLRQSRRIDNGWDR